MAESAQTAYPQPDARERLLSAALVLFTQRSYAAASVREICAAAGVTKPVLYYYFKSKEGLYLELMEGANTQFEDTVAQLIAFPGTTQERVIHFCEGVFHICIANLPVVRLMYSIYFGPPQGVPIFNVGKSYYRMLEILSVFVQEGIDRGEIRYGNVDDTTWTIMACLSTAIDEQLCHETPRIDVAKMVRMLNIVFDAIAVKGT